MNSMNRTYFYIGGGVVLALILLIGGYFLFFRSTSTVTIAPENSATLPQASQTTFPSTSASSPAQTTAPKQVSSRLVKISAGPAVPGEVVVDGKATASSSAPVTVMYLERQSGNVYSYQKGTGVITRTSNRTIPGIQSATWLADGSLALIRYLSGSDFSTINTFALPANGTGGFFLPQNLAGIAVSSSTLLTTASGVNGSSVSTERADGSHPAQLFTTPLSQLLVSFAGKNKYLAVPKPSAALNGAAFLVDSTGHFSRMAGPAQGLSALASPSGRWLFVSLLRGGTLTTELVDTQTGAVTALPLATLAEKCVWTADDSTIYCGVPASLAGVQLPDDWYQGAAHFTDRLWRIDINGRYAQFVFDVSKEAGVPIDAEALAIDPNRSTLVFVDKNTGALWSYSL